MSKENIIELFKYNNHRLVEMRICAEEQEFIEDWGVLKGIPLHTFLIINKIIKEEMRDML